MIPLLEKLLMKTDFPFRSRVPDALMTIGVPLPVPKMLSIPNANLPASIVVPPVKVLTAASVSVPVPALMSPFVPAIAVLTITLLPVPSALTVMVGVVPAKVRIFAGVELLASVQLAGVVLISVSPNVRWPMVTGESRLTVVSAGRSRVLKSEVVPAPLPMRLFSQLPAIFQAPPEELFQTAAWVMVAVKPVGWVKV